MTGAPFQLDPRLAAGSEPVADGPLCAVRLQDDGRWPWLVLIPRRDGLTELAQLSAEEWALLAREIAAADAAVRALGAALGLAVEKVNVAALGNVVPQLHVHVVGRRGEDAAWPGPIWGVGRPEPLSPAARAAGLEALRASLGA